MPYRYLYARKINNTVKKYQRIPERVMIENTNICNANCVFCPHKVMKRKVGVMDLALSKKIISECRQLNINYLTIYGFGEPLLDKYFFERVAYAKELGIPRVTTNTNAMYMDKKAVNNIFDSRIDEIYISFDAATEKTYQLIRPGLNFSTVENNINYLLKEKKKRGIKTPKIILSFVESQTNSKEVEAYLEKWQNKVDGISISIIHNWTGQIEAGITSNHGFRDPCRLLWTDMVISWDGKVPLCCNDYENRVILGDCRINTIEEIWGGKILDTIRQDHINKNYSNVPVCSSCTYNYHHKSPWWVIS